MGLTQLLAGVFSLVRTPVTEASVLLNNTAFAVAFSIALVLVLTYAFKEQKRLPFMVAAVVVALLLGAGLKEFLQVPRPCVDVPGKIACPVGYSLPSLHALLTFTLVILAVGNRSFFFYLIYALFVAFSRVFLGVHTLTQVMAGVALAFFACVLTEMAWRRMRWEMPEQVYIRHEARRPEKK